MKKLLLASASLMICTSVAFAADLPSRRAPPVYAPVPVFSWTGFYIGGQVGYAFGRDSSPLFNAAGAFVDTASSRPNGIIGGAHVGYNFSTQGLPLFGSFMGTGGVIGLEGDVDGTDYRRLTALPLFGGTESVRAPIQGSIRGRLGVAFDRALFYATGGAAFATFRNSYTFVPAVPSDTASNTRVGYTVGGGVEYAITNNWSLRAEYRYSDFGTFTQALPINAAGFTFRHRETEQRAQVGFSYKFDTAVVPVVARY